RVQEAVLAVCVRDARGVDGRLVYAPLEADLPGGLADDAAVRLAGAGLAVGVREGPFGPEVRIERHEVVARALGRAKAGDSAVGADLVVIVLEQDRIA